MVDGVDGGSDEGPSHLEVQFWWTEFHLSHSNLHHITRTLNCVEWLSIPSSFEHFYSFHHKG